MNLPYTESNLTRTLLILPLLLLLISCTITKRVHRPGYHVQWRSIHRTQEAQEHLTKQDAHQADNEIDVNALSTKETALIKQNDVQPEIVSATRISPPETRPHEKKPIRERLSQQLTEIPATPPQRFVSSTSQTVAKHRQSSRPILWQLSPSTLKTVGTVFMCIGIFLLLGSALVSLGAFSGAGNGNGAAWFNFFLDLIAISEWFWLLVFIVLIVLALYVSFLFVRYVMGGALLGLIVGGSFFILGVFLYALGASREEKMTE